MIDDIHHEDLKDALRSLNARLVELDDRVRRLVEMAAKPGELVVDPFLGSGTTALACLATGRRFLGADVDPGAVSLTLERLAAAEGTGTTSSGESAGAVS